MKLFYTVSTVFCLIVFSCSVKQTVKEGKKMVYESETDVITYPVLEKRKDSVMFREYKIYDNYSWIKNTGIMDSDVQRYLKKESEYAKKKLSEYAGTANEIYSEIISRTDQDDMSVPVKKDDYYYYSRDIEGQQYPVYCRKYKSTDAKEEVVLNLNTVGGDTDYADLGIYSVSPDHKYLAYSLDKTGDEKYTLHIKNIARGTHFSEKIKNVDDVEWAETRNTFFYTTVDSTNRTNKVSRHILGTDPSIDRILFEERDRSYYLWIEKSKDRRYIFLGSANKNSSEFHYLKSDDPMGYFELISPRKEGVEYYVEHNGEDFYILTNYQNAYNFKLMKVNAELPVKSLWKEVFPHKETIFIDDFDMFKDHIVLSAVKKGRRSLSVFDIGSKEIRDLKFNEECYTVSPGSNPMFESNKYRYVYESLTTPYSIEEYDIKSGETKVLKKQKVLNDFDLSGLRSELIYARASDGEEIPVSVVYMSKKFKKDGTNPLLLEGYGAYGDFNDPYFSVSRLSLLERGFIYAIAHVRGGLEKGKKWHYDGMLLNKKNTFTDFISCSEHLISEGYTSKDKLVILGESAGGMLIGAVLNMRSDLYRSAVLDVPFLDVLNTMLDPGLSATVTEYDEWGDPTEKKYFEYISSYCPYQNIQEQEYPNVLVIAGLNDPRVSYWEPLKWAAKIRDLNTGDNEVILLLNSSGHSGSSGRYDHYRETAKKYSYILNSVGYKN